MINSLSEIMDNSVPMGGQSNKKVNKQKQPHIMRSYLQSVCFSMKG